jgi:outer membrane protein TolC
MVLVAAFWLISGSALAQPAEPDNAFSELVARPGGLTADDAARRATASSHDVEARESSERAARADRDRASVGYFPRLTLTGRYTRVSPLDQQSLASDAGSLVATPSGEGPVPPGTTLIGVPGDALGFPVIENQYLLQANVTVPLSDYLLRTGQRYDSAELSRRSAEIGVVTARRDAALRGRLAYYAWVRARLQEVVAAQSLEQARAHLRLANAAGEAGRLPRVDILRAESHVSSAELLAERARQLSAIAEDQLRTVMHDARGKRYEIGEDPMRAVSRAEAASMDGLYARAIARRPEIRALEKASEALEEQGRVARAGNYPRLDAFGNAYYANPNPRLVPPRDEWRATWDVGLQVTWSPNDLGTSGAEERAALERKRETDAHLAALRDAIRGEVVRAYEERKTARFALEASDRAVRLAEEAYRGRVLLFEQGRASTVELVDAETELLRARLDQVNAHVDLLAAWVRLDHAVGSGVTAPPRRDERRAR